MLLNETREARAVTIFVVGCNKGDDFVAQMQEWSGDSRFSVSSYRATMARTYAQVSPRSCPPRPAAGFRVAKRSIRGFCVEPMPKNFEMIERTMKALGLSVGLVQAAISSVPGSDAFPDGDFGVESMGLGYKADSYAPVRVTTIDEIVHAERIASIQFLSIDTEGNDFRAILGGLRTLAAGVVHYLEFEYHQVGRWVVSDLQDLVDLLDQLGFDCYWALNTGGLSRLTGCWHDSYYADRYWSNVACIDRGLQHTHRKMQQLSGFA